jgi:hypothetical protein
MSPKGEVCKELLGIAGTLGELVQWFKRELIAVTISFRRRGASDAAGSRRNAFLARRACEGNQKMLALDRPA